MSSAPALLTGFEAYGLPAQESALGHFGKSIEEVEGIFGVPTPSRELRYELGLMLWKYARGEAGQDGSERELPSQVRRNIKAIDKAAQTLRNALVSLDSDTVIIMLNAGGVDLPALLEKLEVILSVTGKHERSKGGRPADVEYGLLMARVENIFKATTQQRATVTTDHINNVFCGPFFRIAELVDAAAASATQRPRKTNKALGKFLERLLPKLGASTV